MAKHRHNTLSEGLLVGALGASTVAAWFLVVDLIAGQPFYTPMALGAALFGGTRPTPGAMELGLLVGYTVFHYAAFTAVGIVAAASTHLAATKPVMLALFPVLFVTFEAGFMGMVALLHETDLLGSLTWYQIGAGNLLASAVMGATLLRLHPSIRRGISYALSR